MASQILERHPPWDETGPNGFKLDGCPFYYEYIEDYRPGGHHPVHLGDELDGRYRVIHKLGHGGFANVWLCRDLTAEIPTYVALKILMACFDNPTELLIADILKKLKGSDTLRSPGANYLCLPLEHFELRSPAGFHHSSVLPVCGPKVSQVVQRFEDQDRMLRKISLHAAQAMRTLHDAGICHGDFRPSNILLQTTGLDGLSEQEVLQAFGRTKPEIVRVITRDPNERFAQCAQYLVKPVDSSLLNKKFLKDELYLIDFGVSYEISSPPEHLRLPLVYRPPEAIFDGRIGISSDLWALACTLFEIRTGSRFIGLPFAHEDSYLSTMVSLLGAFPEPWWTMNWQTRGKFYKDEPDSQGRAVDAPSSTGETMDAMVRSETGELVPYRDPRSIQDLLENGTCVQFEGIEIESHDDLSPFEHRDIPSDEIEVFADLLEKILRYDPDKRLGLQQIEQHDWFKM